MNDLDFIGHSAPLTLAALATCAETALPAGADPNRLFVRVAALDVAGPDEVTVFEDHADAEDLGATRAGACFVASRFADAVPAPTIALVADQPVEALRRAIAILHPYQAASGARGIDRTASVHAEARLEQGVVVEAFAVVGPGVEIGTGTTIGVSCVIGAGVRIGRGCAIESRVDIRNALIGDRVVVHCGVCIGFDGPISNVAGRGLVGRIGRVIIQDDVEIGANTAIARGGLRDTVVGEGSRIGPLAAIAGGTRMERRTRIVGGGFSSEAKMV